MADEAEVGFKAVGVPEYVRGLNAVTSATRKFKDELDRPTKGLDLVNLERRVRKLGMDTALIDKSLTVGENRMNLFGTDRKSGGGHDFEAEAKYYEKQQRAAQKAAELQERITARAAKAAAKASSGALPGQYMLDSPEWKAGAMMGKSDARRAKKEGGDGGDEKKAKEPDPFGIKSAATQWKWSGGNIAASIKTFALKPVVRAVMIGGGIGGGILAVLLFIQQALMIGMTGLMKMVGALAKVVGMIVKPIFDILMIALLPLLYLLMPFIKTMNLIFAPLRKRLMEKISDQVKNIQANGGDLSQILDWGNMSLLLFEAIGGIFTTIIGSLVESIAKGLIALVGIISPETAAGLQAIVDFIGDIVAFAESTIGRDNIDTLTGAVLALGAAAWIAGITSIPKLVAAIIGLGAVQVGGTTVGAAAGGAGAGIVAGATGIVTWIVTGICGAIAGVLAVLPVVTGLGIAAAGIAILIVGSIIGGLAYEFVPGAKTVFDAVSGFINDNLITPVQNLLGLPTYNDKEDTKWYAPGTPDMDRYEREWAAQRNKAGYEEWETATRANGTLAASISGVTITADTSLSPITSLAAAIKALGIESAAADKLVEEAKLSPAQLAAQQAALSPVVPDTLQGSGGRSIREIDSARWDAAREAAGAAAGERYEQAMTAWNSMSDAMAAKYGPSRFFSPERIMRDKDTEGYGPGTPIGQDVMADFYAQFPELVGYLTPTGPSLDMFTTDTNIAALTMELFAQTGTDAQLMMGKATITCAQMMALAKTYADQARAAAASVGAASGGGTPPPTGTAPAGSGAAGAAGLVTPEGTIIGWNPDGTPIYVTPPGGATGGYVGRSGLAVIHKGETLIPADGGRGGNVNINFSGSFSEDLKRDLRDFMESYMRDQLTRRGS